ncbi:hypothetical protein GGD50_000370 [Rhizobium paranaense]|uniref:Uncharacterized protein n=1 Tax=Rhizobium paranaense TaxID=1650438 RepID=A0A7W8XM74_9HYPH|nr:hypothetical protein [Rhizobium paranaense]
MASASPALAPCDAPITKISASADENATPVDHVAFRSFLLIGVSSFWLLMIGHGALPGGGYFKSSPAPAKNWSIRLAYALVAPHDFLREKILVEHVDDWFELRIRPNQRSQDQIETSAGTSSDAIKQSLYPRARHQEAA